MLESKLHDKNSFVTLTYNEDKIIPIVCNDGVIRGNLYADHVSSFIKRLRKKSSLKIRYLAVGEYGDKSQRPHYHLALFGYPSCAYGKPRHTKTENCKCPQCQEIQSCWHEYESRKDLGEYGFTYNGELNKNSAQYIAGYVTKKLTNKKNEEVQKFLLGRNPEFARMSNRPGIGADAMDFLRDILESDLGVDELSDGDVPMILKHGNKKYPLGRYLREKLREKLGYEDKTTPKEVLLELSKESYKEAFEIWQEEGCPQNTDQKKLLIDRNKQKVLNMETRTKLFKQKRSV